MSALNPEIWNLIALILLPVITGIIAWLWKLDDRLFALHSKMLVREEFLGEMRAFREELASLQTALRNHR